MCSACGSGKRAQNVLHRAGGLAGVLAIIAAGLCVGGAGARDRVRPPPKSTGGGTVGLGLAMVFVLLTYGGWNEAAYLSAEVARPSAAPCRVALVGGHRLVTALYLL